MEILAFAIFSIVFGLSFAEFKKCCPEGEIVQLEYYEDNELSPRKHFSCVQETVSRVKPKSKRESEGYEVDNSTSARQMISLNILVDENTHWPVACGDNSDLSISILSESLKASQSASCVDILNSNYYLFTCDEGLDRARDFKDIYKFRKCCDKDSSYDIFTRSCVTNNQSDFHPGQFKFLGDKFVTFETGLPECKSEDALVEYHSLVHKLKIYETSLIITATNGHGPDVLGHNSYCIETTSNSDAVVPDGADEQHIQNKASSKWIAKICRPKTICNEMPCVRKCCKEGERMVYENETSFCEHHEAHLDVKFHRFNIEWSHERPDVMVPTEFGVLMPKHCDKFWLDPDEDPHFISGVDGSLFIPNLERFHSNHEYCVENFYDKDAEDATTEDIKLSTFVCFDQAESDKIKKRFHAYATLLAISAFFLAVTFFVYIFLPKLLNLHGKTLVCHVLSLFIAYSLLAIVQFEDSEVKPVYCKIIAYVLFCSFLSAFSWLNVMCLDIFWTIGSIRMSHGIRRTKEMKRFICYSLYAWGFPCLATFFTYTMDTYNVLPQRFKPNIGESSCWFVNSSPGHVIFFLAPVGIQVLVNVVLFIITAIHCNRVKSEIHRMQMNDNCEQKRKRYIADKAIFIMNLKLFIVMGISWLLEIFASVFDNNPSWWYVSDGFNLLQGVLVFFIFVFKRSVFVAFQKKLGIRATFRPKTPGSTITNMSTLDLHSTGNSKANAKMLKSNSSSTLTNTAVVVKT